jgi:acyl-CoA thioesterase-1
MRRSIISGCAAFLILMLPCLATAQLVGDFKLPNGRCCLPSVARNLADQLLDWNQLGRYHEDNLRLQKLPMESSRVVFFGDSITDMWKLSQYFGDRPYVNRGISGQTTAQMLVRMYPDVINLHPAALVILAGTNDIAQNTGPQSAEMVQDNFRAMTELAQKHNIAVVLCSLLPISDYTERKQSLQRPPADILRLNDWLKGYAGQTHAVFVDYFSALVDDRGFLKEGLSNDGLHPNEKGYAIMTPLVQAGIDKAPK